MLQGTAFREQDFCLCIIGCEFCKCESKVCPLFAGFCSYLGGKMYGVHMVIGRGQAVLSILGRLSSLRSIHYWRFHSILYVGVCVMVNC